MRMTRRMPHTRWVASLGGRLKLPNKKHHPEVQPTRNVSVERMEDTQGNHNRIRLSHNGEKNFLEPHPRTEERPFPHFQSRCVADTLFGPFRLGDDGWDDTVQRETRGSEEEERGGGHPGQDGETERIGGSVDELLGKGFDWFGHFVVVR